MDELSVKVKVKVKVKVSDFPDTKRHAVQSIAVGIVAGRYHAYRGHAQHLHQLERGAIKIVSPPAAHDSPPA
jgi:hypothetical protein